MKNAVLLHGHGGSPDSFWLPWLSEKLSQAGYNVQVPQLPDTNHPRIESQLSFVLAEMNFDEETVLVGHSSGCALILGILDSINVKVAQAILVAGFASPLKGDDESALQLRPFNWDNIRSHVNEIIFINSDNDPWGADDIKGREMLNHLGGKLIIPSEEGHMGSDKFNQPYKEFPLLLKLIE